MAGIQKVSCESMKRDAATLAEILGKMPKTIEQLHISLKNLARCWEGPAWNAYQNQVNQDIQEIYEIYNYLAELQKSLGKGREIYLKTEYDIYTDLKSLWI